MADVVLSPDIRDRGLEAVGESIYVGLSPDLYDGLSEAEFRAMETVAPRFFDSWLGKHVGLPGGFEQHYRKDVLPDMQLLRNHPIARDGARKDLRDILADPKRVGNLYRPGGDTYSEVLNKWAEAARNEKDRIFPDGPPIDRGKVEVFPSDGGETGMFRRSPRAGRNRKLNGRRKE